MIIFVIILLLVVFLFFLFLHLYARKFLPQGGETNQTPPILIIGARVHRRGSFLVNVNNNGTMSLRKAGLESCVISTIPRFVFQEEKQEGGQCDHGLECVICLSPFENGQVGRRLPSCDHAFHIECIDMWLYTHATCPICRASAVHVSSQLPEDGVGPPQESAQRPSDLREMSGEVSSRLEVIVEVPSVENR